MDAVERAARELCVAAGNNPDQPVMASKFQTSVSPTIRAPGSGPFKWQEYVPQVQIVLSAIRNPGEDVKRQAWGHPGSDGDGHPADMAIWHLMIDALARQDC